MPESEKVVLRSERVFLDAESANETYYFRVRAEDGVHDVVRDEEFLRGPFSTRGMAKICLGQHVIAMKRREKENNSLMFAKRGRHGASATAI